MPKYVDMSEFEHQDRQIFVDYRTNIAREKARLMEEHFESKIKKAIVNLSDELDMIVSMSSKDFQFDYATAPKVGAIGDDTVIMRCSASAFSAISLS